METQNRQIMQYLDKGGVLTTMKIMRLFGCCAATKRISEIRQGGYPVETRMVKKNGKRYAAWSKKRDNK